MDTFGRIVDLERRVAEIEEQVAAIHGDRYLDRLSDQADRIKALEDVAALQQSGEPPDRQVDAAEEHEGVPT